MGVNLAICKKAISLIKSNSFYLVFLCFIFLAFLLALLIRLSGNNTGSGFLVDLIPFLAIPASFVYIILFILPGYLITRILIIKGFLDKKYMLLLAIVFSSLISFIIFWIFYFNNVVGKVVSVATILACVAYVIFRFKKLKNELLDKDFIIPLTLVFFTGCLYLSILFLHYVGDYPVLVNNRFVPYLPIDNVIPHYML